MPCQRVASRVRCKNTAGVRVSATCGYASLRPARAATGGRGVANSPAILVEQTAACCLTTCRRPTVAYPIRASYKTVRHTDSKRRQSVAASSLSAPAQKLRTSSVCKSLRGPTTSSELSAAPVQLLTSAPNRQFAAGDVATAAGPLLVLESPPVGADALQMLHDRAAPSGRLNPSSYPPLRCCRGKCKHAPLHEAVTIVGSRRCKPLSGIARNTTRETEPDTKLPPSCCSFCQ